jgi:phosphopantetheine adenylyltransferase
MNRFKNMQGFRTVHVRIIDSPNVAMLYKIPERTIYINDAADQGTNVVLVQFSRSLPFR